jgi:hypothetical protein
MKEYKSYYKSLSFIYFIIESQNNYVKIGRSVNVEKRLNSLKTSTPAKLSLEIEIPTYHDTQGERFFHSLFSQNKIRGEWFNINQDEFELLKELNINLISRGYSLIDILVDSNNIYTRFNTIEEMRIVIENWIVQNYNTTSSKDKTLIQAFLNS